MPGTFDSLFGDDEEKPKGGAAFDGLFGGDAAPDMDFSSSPMEVPRDNSPLGILNQLLHGNAQRDQEKYESALAAQGVTYDRPSVAGMYMSLMSPLGAAGKGAAGVAKSVANETIMGAAMAALEEFQAGTPPQELLGALLKAGGISGAADLALQGVGKLGRGAGNLLTDLGAKARNVVAGGTKKEAQAILERFDQPEAIDEMLGGLLEKHSQSPWYGRSSSGYLKDIKSQLPGAESAHADALAQGAAEGVESLIPDAWSNVQSRAAQEAATRGNRAFGDAANAEAAAFRRIAEDLAGAEPPRSLSGFVQDKSALQAAASGNDAFRSIADSASDRATGFAGRVMRDELDKNLMGYATPETYDAFIDSRDKVRDLKTIEELLSNKVAGEQSGGDFGNALSGAILGAGAGLAGSALTPGDDASMLGVGGAAAGLATGTRSALRQAAGSWGADFGANVLKGGGAALRGIGGTLGDIRAGAITARAQSIGDDDRSRGHNAVAAVEQALKTNPAQLGPYAERLANAADPRVEILVLQDEDPQFRQLMRQLSAGAR
jgi:hypothetical protein